MKISQHFGKVTKELPANAQTAAHQLMIRAGYIKQLSSGVYSYLPLMVRTLNKISDIVRQEMNMSGAEELLMPALQPVELWQESGRFERYAAIDGIMFAFEDRRNTAVCLGPTHEEVITDLVRRDIDSYRDLPKNLYQIQTKFRDEIRPRFGLMRAREFIMKDAYSFDVDAAGLDQSYEKMRQAYTNIFKRLGANFRMVDADAGAIGGEGGSQEFMILAETGEDTLIFCDSCEYAANAEKAGSRLSQLPQAAQQLSMEAVEGRGIIGVQELSKFLNIPVEQTTKTLLYQADDQIVAVMLRGDCALNEVKLQNYLGVQKLALLDPKRVTEVTGAAVGYAGPVNLPKEIRVLADHYVSGRTNIECGANATDFHNINMNIGRDCPEPEYADLKLAKAGDQCACCADGKLDELRGIEVGHIFKLGSKYSEQLKCSVLDETGKKQAVQMGCYGIGISRLAAAVVEQSHDEQGIVWPIAIAPYQVHLVGLNLEKPPVRIAVEAIYQDLLAAGIEVFYDDRELRAGEKFSTADLIGIPIRLTVSTRTIANKQVEYKLRSADKVDARFIPMADLIPEIRKELV